MRRILFEVYQNAIADQDARFLHKANAIIGVNNSYQLPRVNIYKRGKLATITGMRLLIIGENS